MAASMMTPTSNQTRLIVRCDRPWISRTLKRVDCCEYDFPEVITSPPLHPLSIFHLFIKPTHLDQSSVYKFTFLIHHHRPREGPTPHAR